MQPFILIRERDAQQVNIIQTILIYPLPPPLFSSNILPFKFICTPCDVNKNCLYNIIIILTFYEIDFCNNSSSEQIYYIYYYYLPITFYTSAP